MSNESMAYSLFKFLQKGVTVEQLQESTDKAFGKAQESPIGFKRVIKEEKLAEKVKAKPPVKKVVKKVKEGKVVADPSTITDAEGTIQTLAEETSLKEPVGFDKDNKLANSGITPDPMIPKVVKDIKAKLGNSKDAAKLTQDKDGFDPNMEVLHIQTKEEKEITPCIDSVKEEETQNPGPDGTVVTKESKDVTTKIPDVKAEQFKKTEEVSGLKKEKAENESILPTDPSTITNPAETIQKLAEERVLTTVSDENVAKDIQSKYPGSRTVKDEVNGKPQWIIMVTETKKEIKEEVDVTVSTEDKKVDVNTTPEGTTVTTSDVNATPVSAAPEVLEPVVPEIAPEEKSVEETPAEVSEDEDTLMAEKIYVTELLKGKSSLTEKEQKFIKEVESVVLSEAKKAKVMEKVVSLKNKSNRK